MEVSKNVKNIAVTSRTSKLQVFKVWQLRDLNPRLPRESQMVPGYSNVLYIFGNLQSLSFWTREIRSVVAFSDYDMLSRIPLGLLHNEGLVQSQTNRTVFIFHSVLKNFSSHVFLIPERREECLC